MSALHFGGAALLFVWLLFMLFGPPPAIDTGSLPTMFREDLYLQRQLTTYAALIGIPVTLGLGVGLWRLKSWGRGWALVLYGSIIAVAVLGSMDFAIGPNLKLVRHVSLSAILTALFFGAAFYYLCRPEVNKAFRDEPKV
ncbi:MAG TPA: hypothetical protein VF826_12495 [Chloroflexia bacterium]